MRMFEQVLESGTILVKHQSLILKYAFTGVVGVGLKSNSNDL